MPHFEITEKEMRGLAEFLHWADQTDTQSWLWYFIAGLAFVAAMNAVQRLVTRR